MKKGYLFIITGLGILLLCGVMIGNSILRKVNRDKEMMRMMEEQKIVFICCGVRYADSYQNTGYFIDSNGNKHFFDVTDEFEKRSDQSIESVYNYLIDCIEEYEKKSFLKKEQVYECYTYLNLIDSEAEIIEECVMFDYGICYLYGICPTKNGELEFILLEKYGDWEGYNTDKYAQRIVKILGKDTWMEDF